MISPLLLSKYDILKSPRFYLTGVSLLILQERASTFIRNKFQQLLNFVYERLALGSMI